MSGAAWFRHDAGARRDPKLIMLRFQQGLEAVGMYWILVEVLSEQKGYTLQRKFSQALCHEFGVDEGALNAFLKAANDLGLIVVTDEEIYSPGLLTRMGELESRREYERQKKQDARSKKDPQRKEGGVPEVSLRDKAGTPEGVPNVSLQGPSTLLSSSLLSSTQISEGGSGETKPADADVPSPEVLAAFDRLAAVESSPEFPKALAEIEAQKEAEKPDKFEKFRRYVPKYLDSPDQVRPKPWQSSNLWIAAGKRPFIEYPNVYVTENEFLEIVDLYADKFPIKNERVKILTKALRLTNADAVIWVTQGKPLASFNAYARLTGYRLSDVLNTDTATERFNAAADRAAGGR